MDFYTPSEIFISLLYSILFGICFGIVSVGVSIIVDCFESLINLPKHIIDVSFDLRKTITILKGEFEIHSLSSNIKTFVKDFVFVFTYGIAFSVLLYLTTDGEFRFYVFLISIASAYVSNKTLGKICEACLYKLLKIICSATIVSTAVILAPPFFVARRIYGILVLPICNKISGKIKINKRFHSFKKIIFKNRLAGRTNKKP